MNGVFAHKTTHFMQKVMSHNKKHWKWYRRIIDKWTISNENAEAFLLVFKNTRNVVFLKILKYDLYLYIKLVENRWCWTDFSLLSF